MIKKTITKKLNEIGNLYEDIVEVRIFGIKIFNKILKSNCYEDIKDNIIPNKIGYKL